MKFITAVSVLSLAVLSVEDASAADFRGGRPGGVHPAGHPEAHPVAHFAHPTRTVVRERVVRPGFHAAPGFRRPGVLGRIVRNLRHSLNYHPNFRYWLGRHPGWTCVNAQIEYNNLATDMQLNPANAAYDQDVMFSIEEQCGIIPSGGPNESDMEPEVQEEDPTTLLPIEPIVQPIVLPVSDPVTLDEPTDAPVEEPVAAPIVPVEQPEIPQSEEVDEEQDFTPEYEHHHREHRKRHHSKREGENIKVHVSVKA